METDILLSTFNGERYLRQQIESILAQEYSDWRLLIRDDGSNDNTLKIIDEYCNRYRNKIVKIQDDRGNIGSCRSFEVLMNASNAPYIMFCDQDDIWLPTKIGRSVNTLKKNETSDLAVITHCDLKVVDSNLNIIDESFINYTQTDQTIYNKNFRYFAISNYIPGCTMCINKKAKEISLPINSDAIMHDWWILLRTCYLGGKIIPIPESLILYRQHNNNVCGAEHQNFNLLYYFKKITAIPDLLKINKKLYKQSKCAININLYSYLLLRVRLFWHYKYRIHSK